MAVHVHHSAARKWLDEIDEGGSILFCRATQQSFLRLLSTPAVFAPYGLSPLTNEEAWDGYSQFLADERVTFQAVEPDSLDEYWAEYSSRGTSSPGLWMDAYLAAFARAARYTLVTTDAAYRQFRDLDLLLLS
jgi:toxin-antitoxin system PIN domain toxin